MSFTGTTIKELIQEGASISTIETLIGRKLTAKERAQIEITRIKAKKGKIAQSAIERVHKQRASARDVQYGAPENLTRRRRYERDTAKWLKYYLAEAFPLPWAEFHLRYIADLDYIAKNGGWKAEALPRGSGKTTIAEGVALKYLLTGKSRFLAMISATGSFSKEAIKDIKTWLQGSDRLHADYPEVTSVIRHTNGIPQAMKSATANGDPVVIEWTANQIVLPDCKMIMPSGKKVTPVSENAVIRCEGITGSIRGMKYATASGKILRPDMAIVDDPQTRESSRSPEQTRQRIEIIKADIAGLAGPSKDIRIVVPCTIIERDDLADELTNYELAPDFLGERQPFFLSMPKNMELWHAYNEIRKEGISNRDRGKSTADFYKKNKARLTEGVEVTWIQRKGDNAVDGIQWGMDQYFKLGEKGFASELQNEPVPGETMINLSKQQVLACEGSSARWKAHNDTVATTFFIDLNPRTYGLFWSVISFEMQMSGRVLAYGNYPGKNAPLVPEGSSEQQEDAILFESLRKLCTALSDARIVNERGDALKIDLGMIDGGYNFKTVQRFVQAARMPFQLAVSRGRASTKYLDTGRDVIKAMDKIHLRKNPANQRYLSHNTDSLREMVNRAFQAGPKAPGGIEIHKSPPLHDEFAESIISTRLVDKAEGVRGIMYRWARTPGGQDHLLDCVVGCYAAAHWLGIESMGTITARGKSRRRGLKIRNVKI